VSSYDSATLKVTELFSTGHYTANVCLWRLHWCVLDFKHLSAMVVAEMAESTNLNGCPHTFGHVVYIHTHTHIHMHTHPYALTQLMIHSSYTPPSTTHTNTHTQPTATHTHTLALSPPSISALHMAEAAYAHAPQLYFIKGFVLGSQPCIIKHTQSVGSAVGSRQAGTV
jgi:hypothetical protein